MITHQSSVAPRSSVNQDYDLTSYAEYESTREDDEDGDNGYTPIDLTEIARREMERLGVDHGMYLSWRNLSYYTKNEVCSSPPTFTNNMYRLLTFWVNRPKVKVKLLSNASGFVKPGMLVALLGPPGSGKTTLLEVLAGKKPNLSKHRRGEVMVNGQPWTKDFNRVAGFVTQEDYHIPTMTVRETMRISSYLRNHPNVGRENMDERVEIFLKVLGLDHVADTIVGGEMLRGVSGGERKRVSVGVELVRGPAILFLDEPTTGLDASAAMDVMIALRQLADVGIPVVCSLLQPSQELFETCTHVNLMSDRSCVYFGTREGALDHFAGAGYQCPEQKNVAEFLLDLCTPNKTKYYDVESGEPPDLLEYYKASAAYETVGKELWQKVRPQQGSSIVGLESNYGVYQQGLVEQMRVCMGRAFKATVRNRKMITARLARVIIMGLLLGLLFFNLHPNDPDQADANNRVSLIFFCITFTAMGSVAAVPEVFVERAIFYHQHSLHFFRPFAYWFSSVLVDIPLSVVETIIFVTVIYWMTFMNYYDYGFHYLFYLVVIFATNMAAKQFCRLSASCLPTMQLASSIAPGILCIWLVFAGFLIPRNSIPKYWIWLNIITPFRYTFESLCISELNGMSFTCEEDELVPPLDGNTGPPFYGYTTCPISDGEDLLTQYGLFDSVWAQWIDMVILFMFWFLFCLLSFLCLQNIRFHGRRNPLQTSEEKRLLVMAEANLGKIFTPDQITSTGMTTLDDDAPPLPPRAGSHLAFRELTYTVFKPEKKLLNGVNGKCPPGIMVALMGASGAGKSTLLDVLAGRKTGGKIEGEIFLNGYLKDEFFARQNGYVEQTNVFLPTLTVRETIAFSANMRLSQDICKQERENRVDEIMEQLGLYDLRDTLVGPPTSGISPEQRKKLSIAVELVADPSVLFLDEPTSGLDSMAAENVMRISRRVADSGVAVICTIHQPSSSLFFLFDWLLLMKPGGHLIYFGNIGEDARDVITYFERHGRSIKSHTNPADFVLECSGAGVGRGTGGWDPAEAWKNDPLARELDENLRNLYDETSELAANAPKFDSPYAVGSLGQIFQCQVRALKTKYRLPVATRSYMLMYLSMALVLGTLYFQLDFSTIGARNRVSLIFFTIVFAGLGAVASIPSLIEQRSVFYREKPAFLRPVAYFVSIYTAEIPLVFVSSTMFALLLYFMALVNWSAVFSGDITFEWGSLFVYLLIYVTANLCCMSYAMMVAALAPTAALANQIVGVSMSVFALFAGFMIPRDSIPYYFWPIHYLDFYKYALEGMSIDKMVGIDFNCTTADEYVQVPVTDPYTNETYNVAYCQIVNGSQYISQRFDMNTSYGWMWGDAAITLSFLAVFIVVTYLGIRFVNHLKR